MNRVNISCLILILAIGVAGTGDPVHSGSLPDIEYIYSDSPFGVHDAAVTAGSGYDYEAALNAGVRWTRGAGADYILWVKVQRNPSVREYDWDYYDRAVAAVPEGIGLMLNVIPAWPEMIAEDRILDGGTPMERRISDYMESTNSWMPRPELKDDYQAFLRACVERYDGDGIDDVPGLQTRVSAWQIGNEPGLTPDMGTLASLLQLSIPAIRQADPASLIIFPGPPLARDDNYVEVLGRFAPVLDTLKPGDIDAFDFHWFGFATAGYYSKDFIALIRQQLDNRGLQDVRIWNTESGTYSGSPLKKNLQERLPAQTEAEQAAEVLKRIVHPVAHGVERVFWAYGMREGFGLADDTYFNHTGLIYDGQGSDDLGAGVKKLGYFTYKLMTETLGNSDWTRVQVVREGTDNVYIYKFAQKGSGKPIYAAWWDYYGSEGTDTKVRLRVDHAESVKILEAVPAAESGAQLNESDYPGFFNSRVKRVSSGGVSFTLGQKPVFIIPD